MTQKLLPLAVGLALLLLPLAPAGAEEDEWVAKVDDKTLYLSRLADTVAWRMRGALREPGSGPTTILRQIVEERAVGQEARRLGVQVTAQDVKRKWDELDGQIRDMSNGAKNLEKALVEQAITKEEFRIQLRNQLLKEMIAGHAEHLGTTLPKDEQKRIAQTEIVITGLLKRTDVQYGWEVAAQLQEQRTKLAPGVVATVLVYPRALPAPGQPRQPGEPITVQQFGAELLRRLPTKDVKKIIAQECKAALTGSVALSEEEMGRVIEVEEQNWNRWREMAEQEAYRHLSYNEYVKMRYKLDLEEMRRDRYFRGLFGLIAQERAKITPERIRQEYDENKEGIYGDAIQVTDIEILFAPQNPLLGSRGGRSRKDALRLANDILRRHGAGVPFDQIFREVNQRRIEVEGRPDRPDGTFHGRRLTVRNTATGRLLFERALEMEDGQLSRPFETLSEVHVMRREKFVPAPKFEDVKDMILQGMAQKGAHLWLEEQAGDPTRVQIRWPVPARGD